MISRKIIEVKTITDDNGLRPDITLEKGFNLQVLEYSEDMSSAIVEIWSSDIIDLKPEERKDTFELEKFISKFGFKTLESHSKSPEIIGEITKDEIIKDSSKANRIGKSIKLETQF